MYVYVHCDEINVSLLILLLLSNHKKMLETKLSLNEFLLKKVFSEIISAENVKKGH